MVSSVQENHISTVSSSYHHPNQLYSIMSSGLSLAKDLILVFTFMRKGTFSVQPFPAESVWICRRLQLPSLSMAPAKCATRSSIALCSSPNWSLKISFLHKSFFFHQNTKKKLSRIIYYYFILCMIKPREYY